MTEKRCRECEHWGIVDGGSEDVDGSVFYGCVLEGLGRSYSDMRSDSVACDDDFEASQSSTSACKE